MPRAATHATTAATATARHQPKRPLSLPRPYALVLKPVGGGPGGARKGGGRPKKRAQSGSGRVGARAPASRPAAEPYDAATHAGSALAPPFSPRANYTRACAAPARHLLYRAKTCYPRCRLRMGELACTPAVHLTCLVGPIQSTPMHHLLYLFPSRSFFFFPFSFSFASPTLQFPVHCNTAAIYPSPGRGLLPAPPRLSSPRRLAAAAV